MMKVYKNAKNRHAIQRDIQGKFPSREDAVLTCLFQQGSQLDRKDFYSLITQAYRTLKACRSDPTARRRDELDQCPATIKTTIKRLALLLANKDIFGKRRVLLLGDDDLLSVAVAATGLPVRLTVVDLDLSLLTRIERWSQGSKVEVIHHDLRQGLPPKLNPDFDTVFTDPPYTLAGQLLFLKSALDVLRPAKGSSIYLCASRLYLDQEALTLLVDAAHLAGLRLTQAHERFNEYRTPPDVAQDIRNRGTRGGVSFFQSTLFHFSAQGSLLSSALLPAVADDIYSYKLNK